jgi:hypothetical protein
MINGNKLSEGARQNGNLDGSICQISHDNPSNIAASHGTCT